MSLISANRFNELKNKVKSECKRRAYTGQTTGSKSVANFAESQYDYTNTPNVNHIISKEHKDKITIPLSAINENRLQSLSTNIIISENDLITMESFTNVLQGRSVSDSSGTDCAGGCTGMCYGCQTTCVGGCSTGCSTGCTGTCKDGCTGCGSGCDSSCGGDCENGCQDDCRYGCTGCGIGCSDSCYNGCKENCGGTCGDDCTGACGRSSCTGVCAYGGNK